jgi:transcription elongation factor GreA
MSAWEDRPRLAVEANDRPGDGQVVQLGSRVCIRDADGEAQFYVVPPEEADAVADRVSARSPLGGALLGRRVGDVVRFRAPGGVLAVTVVSIR